MAQYTFLVVDDHHAEARRTIQQLNLAFPSSAILHAASGKEAFDLLEESRTVPSLIFLDYILPDMNGAEFIGKLRSRRWLDDAPVAILTEPVADRAVILCYRLGAVAFLTKPSLVHELRETAREFARPSRSLTAATFVPPTIAPRRTAA